jgi:hypothetical protein
MSQHDMVIDNASGATVRADINNAFQALASTSKGNSRPSTAYAGQLWVADNTPSGTQWTVNMYDSADDIPLALVDTTANDVTFVPGNGSASSPSYTFNSDQNTGIFRATGDTLAFSTAGSERLRVDSNGNVQLGDTTYPEIARLLIKSDTSNGNQGPQLILRNEESGNASSANMKFCRSSTVVGSIATTNVATSYNTSSDHRLKQNVAAIASPLVTLSLLKPCSFAFIAQPDIRVDGFLAHEVQAVIPGAVTGRHNEVDASGKPVYQGMDHSKLVPILTAALQAAVAKIETLEARVGALEAA